MEHTPKQLNGHAAGLPMVTNGRARAGMATKPNALELLRAFRRRWVLALASALVAGLVIGVGAWFAVPSAKYVARAQLQVAARQPIRVFSVPDAAAEANSYQRRQLAMLRTRLLLRAAWRKPGIGELPSLTKAADPLDWMDKHLEAEFVGSSEVLRISMKGEDPEEITKIVNAIVDAYLKEVIEKERVERLERLKKLKDAYLASELDMKGRRDTAQKLAQTVGTTDKKALELKQQFAVERLDKHQKELLQVQSDLRKIGVDLEVNKAKLQALGDVPISDEDVEKLIAQEVTVAKADKQAAELKLEYEDLRKRLREEDDPALVAARKQIEAAEQVAKRYREKARPMALAFIKNRITMEARKNANEAQESLAINKAHEKVLLGLIEQLSKDTQSVQVNTIAMESLKADMEASESLNKRIGEVVKQFEFELQGPDDRIGFVELAEVPKTRDEYAQVRMAGLAALIAFGTVLVGISFWEFHARRVGGLDEVVNMLGLPLVGTLPASPGHGSRFLPRRDPDLEARWESQLTESIDAARTMLVHQARQSDLRIVMITSAVSGEGKTSVSTHLATSLARAGYRTLLIDSDMRRPAAHRLFGLEQDPGFCELMLDEVMLDEAIQSTPVEDLSLIAAGNWDAKVMRAMAQGRVKTLFTELKERFDFILVDSSPVLPVADSLLIGQCVDGVLFSVLHGVSRLPTVHVAYERLAALGIHMLGAVVNGTTETKDAYRYTYGTRS